MAAPLAGMFSGQPPRPPLAPPGLPGQGSLLWATPDTPRSSPSTLEDELESFFEACFASHQKFLEIARKTEYFFLQKRLQLSIQKPEQVIKEDISELRNELQWKDALVQKHLTKLQHWHQVLEDVSVQHKKLADIPQVSSAYLSQAAANVPAPMKQT